MATNNLCPVLATPQLDIITSENANSLSLSSYERTPGTTVTITCHYDELFEVVGNKQVTCTNGEWVPDPPECLRKDRTVPKDNTTTIQPEPTSSNTDDYTTILILVSVACGLLLLAILIVILYKFCYLPRRKRKVKADDKDSLFSSQPVTQSTIKSKHKPQRYGIHNPALTSKQSDHDLMSAPASLWSVPPSYQRNDLLNYHLHKQNSLRYSGARNSAGLITGIPSNVHSPGQSEPVSIQATWRGFNTLKWTYISVDQLLRDIEISRLTNPNHSWRDFATLSSRPSLPQHPP